VRVRWLEVNSVNCSRVLLSVLFLFTSAIMCAQRRPSDAETPVIRGTINAVLANANGIVVLTDSRISAMTPSGPQPLPTPGQKLFKLDALTVCTLAGFSSAGVRSFPELATASAQILQEIQRELAKYEIQTFHTKLRMVSAIFQAHLDTIASLRDLNGGSGDIKLTLAGYDTDGKPKIGQVYLHVGPENESGPADEVYLREVDVKKELVWELAGVEDVARHILEVPDDFPKDPAVVDFAKAYKANRASSLTIEQMKSLAKSLARDTAATTPLVGGGNQIATLENGKLRSFEPGASFPEQPPALHFFLLYKGSSTNVGRAGVISGVDNQPYPTVFIGYTMERVARVDLDNNFYFSTEIINSKVFYNGELTRFDSSNHVSDCILVLGPNAKHNPDMVRHLKTDFNWKQVTE